MKDLSLLAKLLAEEDIHVVHRKQSTAMFDVLNRELSLPIWKDMSKNIQDLMTLHEVGHALWTPLEMMDKVKEQKISFSVVNVLEDVRIEKAVQLKYKGAVKIFNKGYQELIHSNFFETIGKKIENYNLIDRINLHYKHHTDVPFSDDEMVWVKKANETVTSDDGSLPLLTPMSEVAGRLSIQAGAFSLQKANGGRGVLLGGVPGVKPGQVLVIGGGVSGTHAAEMAIGLGAEVTILDRSIPRLRQLNEIFGSRINTQYSTKDAIDNLVVESDLVIGAVLIAGAAAPKLVTSDHVKAMRPGAVMVDISIDQGGCFETSKPTTHAEPTYEVDEVVHYCVTNMPGAVPRTSTFALTNATLPFVKSLANNGWIEALRRDTHLKNGLNVHDGSINFKAVAEELGYDYKSADDVISS